MSVSLTLNEVIHTFAIGRPQQKRFNALEKRLALKVYFNFLGLICRGGLSGRELLIFWVSNLANNTAFFLLAQHQLFVCASSSLFDFYAIFPPVIILAIRDCWSCQKANM